MTEEIEISKREYNQILKENPNLIQESIRLHNGNLVIHRRPEQKDTEYVVKQVFIYSDGKFKHWKK